MRLADRLRGERAIQATPWGEWGSSSSSWAGVDVSTTSSLQVLTVYGCVRLIADSIATLPIDVYRETADGRVEIAPPRWLTQPTEYLDRVAWLTQIVTSLLLAGNAYLYLAREPGSPGFASLLPLDPTTVRIDKQPGQPKRFIVGGKQFSSFDILHIPAVMFPGANAGLSPVEAARQSLGLGMAAQEHGARFFGRGLSLPGVIEDPGDPPPERAREMADSFARRHSGRSKSHLPGVLTGGATWKTIGISNEQAQFLESRRYTAAEIAGQMFLVDPSELGIGVEGTSLTYANLEQRKYRLASTTLQPWIVRLEHALSGLLAAPRYVKFNMNAFLRADMATRYAAYAVGINNNFLLPSEAREREDLPPIDGIDDKPLPKAQPTGAVNDPAA